MELKQALYSLQGTSRLASSLVDQIKTNLVKNTMSVSSAEELLENVEINVAAAKIIESLLSRIDELEYQLLEYKTYQEANSLKDQSTDEEIAEFKKVFMASLRSGKIGYVRQFYDRKQFLEMKSNTRKIVADCLIEWCKESEKEPSHLWKVLSLNNGNFE